MYSKSCNYQYILIKLPFGKYRPGRYILHGANSSRI